MPTVKVSGMSCNHCKMAVEKAVREVDGVDSVQVDLGKAQADYTGTADPEKVKAAIKEAGYEPQ